MSNDSECLLSVLSRYDYRPAASLAEMYFGANWRECQNFYAFKFGKYCFLYGTVDGVAYFSFLPIDEGKFVFTEKQFNELVATLKQFPELVYRSPERGASEEVHVTFDEARFHFGVADFLADKYIIPREWIYRHKKFLIANTDPKEFAIQLLYTEGEFYSFEQIYKGRSFMCFTLRCNASFDRFNEEQTRELYAKFSEFAKQAQYIHFPYTEQVVRLKGEVDVRGLFMQAVAEVTILNS